MISLGQPKIPKFYRILVLPENRYYTFNKAMHIDKSITYASINFNGTVGNGTAVTNGCMPYLDTVFSSTTKALYDNALLLSSLKSLAAFTATNGSYVLSNKNKTSCMMLHSTEVAFTTKEACEMFLSELVDIHSDAILFGCANTYGYREYFGDGHKVWLPEELEIVENTITDTYEQSMISPILINPYLPLYSISGILY